MNIKLTILLASAFALTAFLTPALADSEIKSLIEIQGGGLMSHQAEYASPSPQFADMRIFNQGSMLHGQARYAWRSSAFEWGLGLGLEGFQETSRSADLEAQYIDIEDYQTLSLRGDLRWYPIGEQLNFEPFLGAELGAGWSTTAIGFFGNLRPIASVMIGSHYRVSPEWQLTGQIRGGFPQSTFKSHLVVGLPLNFYAGARYSFGGQQ